MESRQEVKIVFGKEGDLIFISHRNIASLLERAMRRAGIPMVFSEGYNPRPRISFPSALETGIASDHETAFVKLARRCETTTLTRDLAKHLPEEIALYSAEEADGETPRSMTGARYEVELPEECGLSPKGMDRAREAVIERDRAGKKEKIKLARYVRRLELHGRNLKMEIAVDAEGSLRPREVLETLGVDDPLALDVRRTHVALC